MLHPHILAGAAAVTTAEFSWFTPGEGPRSELRHQIDLSAGNDVVIASAAPDLFNFFAGSGIDVIVGFDPAHDRVQFWQPVEAAAGPGVFAFHNGVIYQTVEPAGIAAGPFGLVLSYDGGTVLLTGLSAGGIELGL